MKKVFLIGLVICLVHLFTSCEKSLTDYQAKSEDEKQIIERLNLFVDAGNRGDVAAIQDSFHTDGTYKSVRGARITRSQIPETKPEWWTVSGKVALKDPRLQITGERAEVIVTARHGAHYKTTTVYTLAKENGRWLILGVE